MIKPRILFISLILVLTVIIISEVLAGRFVRNHFDVIRAAYESEFSNDQKLKEITWADEYERHPYLGYAPHTIKEFESQPIKTDPRLFVIGIFGGSVAGGFAHAATSDPFFSELLKTKVPELKDRTIKIINFGVGGYKQPQTFILATHFISKIDLAINIDGLNDIVEISSPLFPVHYPARSVMLFYQRPQWDINYVMGQLARTAYKVFVNLPTELDWLSHSALYYLVWRLSHPYVYKLFRGFEVRSLKRILKQNGISEKDWVSSARQQARLATWEKYLLFQYRLFKIEKKPVFFFVQPNQYLANSKVFSDEEKRLAFDPTRMHLHKGLLQLKELAQKIRKKGLPVFDLTGIFSKTVDTVYVDTSGHLNQLGNRIMAQQISQAISTGAILVKG